MIPLLGGRDRRRSPARELADVPDPAVLVTGPVVIDSREAAPGSLFAALPGTRTDGHAFAAAALAAGAVAVLAARPGRRPGADRARRAGRARPAGQGRHRPGARPHGRRHHRLGRQDDDQGPGGAAASRSSGLRSRRAGSFNNEIGHPLTVLKITEQTRYLVSELSARGLGHITELCAIAPPRLGACCASGTPTPASSAAWSAIADGQGRAAGRAAGRRRRHA